MSEQPLKDPHSQAGRKGRAASGISLVELMMVVMILGLLSVVAVPVLSRYLRRARTVEATMNLRKLYDATVAYYATEHSDAYGTALPKQYPLPSGAGGSGWAPTQGACCAQAGQKCAPALSASLWLSPTWQALNFSMDDPFYYSFQTVGSGGSTIGDRYNLEASGDLNCDHNYSLYRRVAVIESNYTVSASSGIYATSAVE